MTSVVKLSVPSDRAQRCCAWLSKQPPEVVARCLELCEILHGVAVAHAEEGHSDKLWNTIEELKQQHRAQLEDLRARLSSEEALRESALETLKAEHKKELENLFAQATEESSKQSELLWQQRFDAAQRQAQHRLLEAQADTQRRVQHLELQLLHAKEEADRRVTMASEETRALREQLEQRRARDLEHREEVRQSFADAIAERDRKLDDKEQLVLNLHRGKEELYSQCIAKFEEMNRRQNDLVASLRGSNNRGEVGERLVDTVFGDLKLGVLDDTSAEQGPGFADRLWRLDSLDIRCLVEIKNKDSLKAKDDLERFRTRVTESVSLGRANGALFLSLGCRVQGTARFDWSSIAGVPCLWVSRAADAPEPAHYMVAIAFELFAQTFPTLNAERAEGDTEAQALLASVSDLLEGLDPCLDVFEQQIKKLKMQGEAQLRQACVLRKAVDDMRGSVLRMNTRHPELAAGAWDEPKASQPQEQLEELRRNPLWKELATSVEQYHLEKKHWPRHFNHCARKPITQPMRKFLEELKQRGVKVSDFSADILAAKMRGEKRPLEPGEEYDDGREGS